MLTNLSKANEKAVYREMLAGSPQIHAKCAVEIRDIAEAAIERDIHYLFALRCETRCCIAQARSTHILMRRIPVKRSNLCRK